MELKDTYFGAILHLCTSFAVRVSHVLSEHLRIDMASRVRKGDKRKTRQQVPPNFENHLANPLKVEACYILRVCNHSFLSFTCTES